MKFDFKNRGFVVIIIATVAGSKFVINMMIANEVTIKNFIRFFFL